MKLIYEFKSKSVKGKYIDAVSLYPTVMYYDRYPVGHITKTSVDNLRENTTQLDKALDIFLTFFTAQGPEHATKINY